MIAIMTPYIATASQKIMETRFLDETLGHLIAQPMIDGPVKNIPQAAPRIEKPNEKPSNLTVSRGQKVMVFF